MHIFGRGQSAPAHVRRGNRGRGRCRYHFRQVHKAIDAIDAHSQVDQLMYYNGNDLHLQMEPKSAHATQHWHLAYWSFVTEQQRSGNGLAQHDQHDATAVVHHHQAYR